MVHYILACCSEWYTCKSGEMVYLASLLLALQLSCVLGALSYNPEDYLEVYPDPTDPEVLRGRTPLHFALIQSLGDPLDQFDVSGSIAGINVALDRINNDSSLLPGYTLHYTFVESECDRTDSFQSFFRQIFHEPTKVALMGSGCSVATEPVAEISHFYNISHISCIASSPELRDRARFPNYFQLLPSDETLAFAYYGIIKEFGWKRVAFIVQDENVFTDVIEKLRILFRDEIQFSTRLFSSDEGIAELGEEPFDRHSRIFIFAMYEENARALLCEAHKRDIRLPQYLLMTPGWYIDVWWRVDDEGLNCTVEERERVLNSTLAPLNGIFLDSSDIREESVFEFISEVTQALDTSTLNLTFSSYAVYCHDATWTLAYALNETLNSIADPVLNAELAQAYNVTPPFGLEDFTYDSHRLLDVMFDHISNTDFEGTFGRVKFGNEGIRTINDIVILQYRSKRVSDTVELFGRLHIGTVSLSTDEYDFEYEPPESEETVWRGLVPYDGIPIKEIIGIHPALSAICIFLASVGIVFAIACLIFNFVYRNSKLIKLASSKLNYVIGTGAIILYMDIIITVIPSTDQDVTSVLCNLTPWLTAIGYSLCYGTILVKMARVFFIFNNPSPNKKALQDWKLLLSVACLVAIDLIILITFTLVEGLRGDLGARLVENPEYPNEVEGPLGMITEYCVHICDSIGREVASGILYGYKMLLQVIALLVAFSIRKVKVKGLNDSKYVAASIYVTSIVLALIIVATFTLRGYNNVLAALFSAGFLIGTTTILLLVFIPLMVGLYKDPEGEMIFSKSAVSTSGHVGKDNHETMTLKNKIKQLEEELETVKQSHDMHVTDHSAPTVDPEEGTYGDEIKIAILDQNRNETDTVENGSVI